MTEAGQQKESGTERGGRSLPFRIFFSRHGDVRAGWRILLFLFLVTAGALLLVRPAAFLLPSADLVLPSFLFVFALLAASWIMTRAVNRKPLGAIGVGLHRRAWREFGIGCVLGFLMMGGIVVVQYGLGYLAFTALDLSAGDMAVRAGVSALFFLTAAAGEELMFRGYLFQTLMQAVTFLPAAVIMSLIFGITHLANPNVTAFAAVNVALAGLWLSFAYLKTRSLWLPLGLHAAWNFSQTTLFSFPTSGQEFLERRLFMTSVSGPEWITGGLFGPEGGVLATLALIVCTWYILKSTMITVPEGIITLDSIEDLIPPALAKE